MFISVWMARLRPFTTDPLLGLKPLGSFAFEAFLLVGAVAAPVLVWSITDVRSVVQTAVMVAVVSGLFVLSAFTLHRQLATAKAGHVRWARGLVAAALGSIAQRESEPADATGMIEALARTAPSLAVAVEIERRSVAIQEWPFDATIIRAVAAILTSVTAVVVARLLLSRFGM